MVKKFLFDFGGEEEDEEADIEVDEEYEDLDAWMKTAKRDLEDALGVRTIPKSYLFYEQLGGFSLKSVVGEGENGESEWIIFRNEDEATEAAKSKIREDLEDDPVNLFSDAFLEQHVNDEDFYEIAYGDAESGWNDATDADLVDAGYLDEDDLEDEEKVDAARQRAIDNDTDDIVRRGAVDYFREMYGVADGVRQAVAQLGINVDAAAEDAVSSDGAGHFLDAYDGFEVILDHGAVAYGLN